MYKMNDKIKIVRSISLFFIMCLMGYQLLGFDNLILNSDKNIMMLAAKTLFNMGVPLLLIGYGYNMAEEKLNFGYYNILVKLAIYFMIVTSIYIGARYFIDPKTFSLTGEIKDALSFTNIPMIWVVEILVCLLLLSPLFNNCWRNTPTKKEKFHYLMILFILCILPTITNVFDPLLPEAFMGLYPVLFYFIGGWIKDYDLINKIKGEHFLVLCLVLGLAFIENINFLYGNKMDETIYNGIISWSSLFGSIAILGMVSSLKEYKWINKVATVLSDNWVIIMVLGYVIMEFINKFVSLKVNVITAILLALIGIIVSIIPALLINKLVSLFINK